MPGISPAELAEQLAADDDLVRAFWNALGTEENPDAIVAAAVLQLVDAVSALPTPREQRRALRQVERCLRKAGRHTSGERSLWCTFLTERLLTGRTLRSTGDE